MKTTMKEAEKKVHPKPGDFGIFPLSPVCIGSARKTTRKRRDFS